MMRSSLRTSLQRPRRPPRRLRTLAPCAVALFIGLSSLGAQSASRRIELDLDKTVESIEASNPDLKNALISLGTALREYDARAALYLPSVSARLSFGYSGSFLGEDGPSPTRSDPSSLGLSLSMSLPLGWDVPMDVAGRTLDLGSQRLALESQRAQLRRDGRKAYLALAKADEDLAIRRRALKLAQDRYQRAKEKYDAGFSSEQDYLRAELSLQNQRPLLLQAEADRRKLALALTRLMGLSGDVELAVADPLSSVGMPVSADGFPAVLERLESHATARKADLDLRILALSLERNRRALLPSLSSGLSWSTSVKQIFTADSWSGLSDSVSFSLGLSLPLDSWLPNSKSALARKRIEDNLLIQENKRRTTLLALRDAIEQIALDIDLNHSSMELSARSVALARKSLEWTKQAHEQGRAGLKELEDAEEALFQAEYALLGNRYKELVGLCDLAYHLELLAGP